MSLYNRLLFSEIFFKQIRREAADLDNLRAILGTIGDTWRYYLHPPEGWTGPRWQPDAQLDTNDAAALRDRVIQPIFGALELTYGPCDASTPPSASLRAWLSTGASASLPDLGRPGQGGSSLSAFFLYGDWARQDRTGLCLVLPYSADIEGRDPATQRIPKGRNHAQQLLRLLRQYDLDWGVLTNGRHWRLLHRTELSPTDTYLDIDLEHIIAADDIESYVVFHRFFSRAAFSPLLPGEGLGVRSGRQRLDFYKQQSDQATKVIEDHLSAQVEEIARQLCQGLVESCRAAGEDVKAPETRREIYKNALYLVYRLLFVLYAEARDLLPLDVPAYRAVCLGDLLAEVCKNHRDGMSYDDEHALWDRLSRLFALIDQGKPDAGVPAYNGGLFDPGRRPFLTGHRIRNSFLQEALLRLGTMPAKGKTYDQDREPQPIDYRDLSVRHLGSLYEGLLEFNLFEVEGEPLVVRAGKKRTEYVRYSSAGKVRADETVLKVGDVYFSETAGERKATGSYYTPEDVVDYIVRNTVGVKLAELKAEFYKVNGIERQLADLADTPADLPRYGQIQRALDEQFRRFVNEQVLGLRILDMAMGSGHFLVNAAHAVANFLVELLNETPWENAEIDSDVATWRRRAAERCIFGVDLNELAVELARLCLWMTTAAQGKPLTFLDHHLRRGNSLVGAWMKDVGVYPLAKEQGKSAFTLPLGSFQVALDQALAGYRELYARDSDDVEEVRQKARIYEQIHADLKSYRDLFSLHSGVLFGNGLDEMAYGGLGNAVQSPETWQLFYKSRGEALLESTEDFHFFHWEIEFPEVFLAGLMRTEGAVGFHVVIGNPPYLRMERIKALTPYLKQQYRLATPRADIFIYFFERSLDVLYEGGVLGFISSGTFARTEAGALLRDYLRDHTTLTHFVDFGDLPVFKGVTAYPAVVVLKKGQPSADHAIRSILAEKLWAPNLTELLNTKGILVRQHGLESSGWRFEDQRIAALRNKIATAGIPLANYCGRQIYRGIVTGLNEAFVLDQQTRDLLVAQDPKSIEILKPLLEGKDLKRWRAEWRRTWLIYTYHGIDVSRYPAIREYLRTFRGKLESRATTGFHKWYELQQPQKAYVSAFESVKIVWPNLQKGPRYSFDFDHYYIRSPACCLPTEDRLIIAILNSSVGWYWMQTTAIVRQNGWIEAQAQYVANIPIPQASQNDRRALEDLTECLSARECPDRLVLEAELNDRVARLYGLTLEEQRIVDNLPLPIIPQPAESEELG